MEIASHRRKGNQNASEQKTQKELPSPRSEKEAREAAFEIEYVQCRYFFEVRELFRSFQPHRNEQELKSRKSPHESFVSDAAAGV